MGRENVSDYFFFCIDEEPPFVRAFRIRTWKRWGMRAGYPEAAAIVRSMLAVAWLGGWRP